MKAESIYYKKLINKGNFEHEEIGITLLVEEGEKASDVLKEAEKFVNLARPSNTKQKEYEKAKNIVNNSNAYRYNEVIDAQKLIEQYEAMNMENENDLPF